MSWGLRIILQKLKEETGARYCEKDGGQYIRRMNYQGQYEYFPVSGVDPDEFYNRLIFTGLFGVHKFAEGQFMKGLLYFATAGFCGVFWLTDIFAVLFGNYRFSDGSYLGRIADRKKALLLLAIGLVINGLIVFLYIKVGGMIYAAIQGTAHNAGERMLEDSDFRQRIIQILKDSR